MKRNPNYHQILDELRALDPTVSIIRKEHPNYYQLVEYLNTMRVDAGLPRTKRHPNYHQFVEGLRELIEEGGVAAPPSWVEEYRSPAGDLPVAAMIFTDGLYYLEGLGEVPISTLLVEEFVFGWPIDLEGAISSAGMMCDGFNGPGFSLALLEKIAPPGFTIVIEFDGTDGSLGGPFSIWVNNGADFLEIQLAGATSPRDIALAGSALADVAQVDNVVADGQISKVAMTGRYANGAANVMSANGSATVSQSNTEEFPTPVAETNFEGAGFFVSLQPGRVRHALIYPIQPDADLQELS